MVRIGWTQTHANMYLHASSWDRGKIRFQPYLGQDEGELNKLKLREVSFPPSWFAKNREKVVAVHQHVNEAGNSETPIQGPRSPVQKGREDRVAIDIKHRKLPDHQRNGGVVVNVQKRNLPPWLAHDEENGIEKFKVFLDVEEPHALAPQLPGCSGDVRWNADEFVLFLLQTARMDQLAYRQTEKNNDTHWTSEHNACQIVHEKDGLEINRRASAFHDERQNRQSNKVEPNRGNDLCLEVHLRERQEGELKKSTYEVEKLRMSSILHTLIVLNRLLTVALEKAIVSSVEHVHCYVETQKSGVQRVSTRVTSVTC